MCVLCLYVCATSAATMAPGGRTGEWAAQVEVQGGEALCNSKDATAKNGVLCPGVLGLGVLGSWGLGEWGPVLAGPGAIWGLVARLVVLGSGVLDSFGFV